MLAGKSWVEQCDCWLDIWGLVVSGLVFLRSYLTGCRAGGWGEGGVLSDKSIYTNVIQADVILKELTIGVVLELKCLLSG